MSFVSHLRCTGCGHHYPADGLMNLCPVDQRPVEMVLDLERLAHERPGQAWHHPERHDMWRYGGLLALDIDHGGDQPFITTLGEGATPLLEFRSHPVAARAGLHLQLKDEGKAHPGHGANPTRSFKDRGMAMTLSMARRFGLERLAIPTQGNAGDSLCEYALAAGLSAVVAMPDDTPLPIVERVRTLADTSDRFHLVTNPGTIRESGELLKAHWIPDGWFSVATFQEPGWRIEGKKTLGLELAEPDIPGEDWVLPDAVIYPTGGGTGVLGMWKAWNELQALGLIGSHRPRVYCIQMKGTRPLVEAFNSGAADTVPAAAGNTVAFGMNVPGGVGHFRVLEIIRASGGAAVAVDEADMIKELANCWQQSPGQVGPEGAACLAALTPLLDNGSLHPGERVVAFNTGAPDKYLPNLEPLL